MPGANKVIARAREVQKLQIAGMTHGMQQAMELIAYYARTEHLYTRRSGNTEMTTEGGLYEATAQKVVGVVSAGMSYDKWLSLIRNGQWSFLWPAMLNHKEEILQIIVDAGSLEPGRKK